MKSFVKQLLSEKKYTSISILLLLLGAFIFLYRNTHESIWFDEACTYGVLNRPLIEVWHLIAGDFHPPLYFMMINIFARFFGNSVFALRSFSAIGALCLAALGIGPIKRIFNKRVGIIFTLLVITTPICIVFAQEMRMYTWVAFWTTAAICYGLLGVREGKRRDWFYFGVCVLGAIYTHFYGILAMISLNAILFIHILLKERLRLKQYLNTILIIIIGSLPWIWNLLGQVNRVMTRYWIPEVDYKTVWRCLIFPYAFKFKPGPFTPWVFLIATAFIVVGFISGRKNDEHDRNAFFSVVGVYGLTIALAIAISVFLRPILVERYLMSIVGVLLLAVAYGISRIQKNIIVVFCILALVGLSIPIINEIYSDYFNGAKPAAFHEFESKLRKDDVIVCLDEMSMGICSYYYPKNELILIKEPNELLMVNHRLFVPTFSTYRSLSHVIHDYFGKRVWIFQSTFTKFAVNDIDIKKVFNNDTITVLESPRGYVGIVYYEYKNELE